MVIDLNLVSLCIQIVSTSLGIVGAYFAFSYQLKSHAERLKNVEELLGNGLNQEIKNIGQRLSRIEGFCAARGAHLESNEE